MLSLAVLVATHMSVPVLQGILDVLLVTVSPSSPPKPQIKAFRNDLSADAYFVKVTVGSGRECPPGRKVSGLTFYTYSVNGGVMAPPFRLQKYIE